MSLLCSLERAKQNIPSVSTSDDRVIAALIAACSSAIEKHLRRRITLAEHDELYDGRSGDRLLLRQYPVTRIDSVRYAPSVVLEVTNTSTTNQQARVEVQRDGLRLLRTASGTVTIESVTWASNATLQAVASAVVALGAGWNARVIGSATGDYGLWPSRDLWIAPSFAEAEGGASLDCRGRWAGLTLHVSELAGYSFDARGWLYRRDPWADVWPASAGAGGWEGGPGFWRVRYTAGYAEVPAAIEEACAEWVAELFQLTRRDPATAVQAMVGSQSLTFSHESMPARVRALLAPFRQFIV